MERKPVTIEVKKKMARDLLVASQGKLSNLKISERIAKKYGLGLTSYLITELRRELGVYRDTRGGHQGPTKHTYASLAKAMTQLAQEYGILELHYTQSTLQVVQKITRTVEFKHEQG